MRSIHRYQYELGETDDDTGQYMQVTIYLSHLRLYPRLRKQTTHTLSSSSFENILEDQLDCIVRILEVPRDENFNP
jgi:hypothetical protein